MQPAQTSLACYCTLRIPAMCLWCTLVSGSTRARSIILSMKHDKTT